MICHSITEFLRSNPGQCQTAANRGRNPTTSSPNVPGALPRQGFVMPVPLWERAGTQPDPAEPCRSPPPSRTSSPPPQAPRKAQCWRVTQQSKGVWVLKPALLLEELRASPRWLELGWVRRKEPGGTRCFWDSSFRPCWHLYGTEGRKPQEVHRGQKIRRPLC